MTVTMGPFARAWVGAIGHHDKKPSGVNEICRCFAPQDDSGGAKDDRGGIRNNSGQKKGPVIQTLFMNNLSCK